MDLSARAYFKDATTNNAKLLRRSQDTIPELWLSAFLRAARGAAPGVIGAPIKSGGLRRNIVTQKLGNRAQVGWRVPYAAAVDAGQHTVKSPVRGMRKDMPGVYATIRPGVYHHRGTGKGFATRAYMYANKQLEGPIPREAGLTK